MRRCLNLFKIRNVFKFKKFLTNAGSLDIIKIVLLPRYSLYYTLEEYRGEHMEGVHPHRAY